MGKNGDGVLVFGEFFEGGDDGAAELFHASEGELADAVTFQVHEEPEGPEVPILFTQKGNALQNKTVMRLNQLLDKKARSPSRTKRGSFRITRQSSLPLSSRVIDPNECLADALIRSRRLE